MGQKRFKLKAEDIRPLALGRGSCIASDMITVGGQRVGFMYREDPSDEVDSGWRFLCGRESQEYLDEPSNLQIYDVNTITNYDPEILQYLDAPAGSAFEREAASGAFRPIETPQE